MINFVILTQALFYLRCKHVLVLCNACMCASTHCKKWFVKHCKKWFVILTSLTFCSIYKSVEVLYKNYCNRCTAYYCTHRKAEDSWSAGKSLRSLCMGIPGYVYYSSHKLHYSMSISIMLLVDLIMVHAGQLCILWFSQVCGLYQSCDIIL